MDVERVSLGELLELYGKYRYYERVLNEFRMKLCGKYGVSFTYIDGECRLHDVVPICDHAYCWDEDYIVGSAGKDDCIKYHALRKTCKQLWRKLEEIMDYLKKHNIEIIFN